MEPIVFPGYNTVMGSDQPGYRSLPTYRHNDDKGTVTSCWKLSLRERFNVLFNGKIYFQLLTFGNAIQPQLPTLQNPCYPKRPRYFRVLFKWNDCMSAFVYVLDRDKKIPLFSCGGGSYMDFSFHSVTHYRKHFYFRHWCFLSLEYTWLKRG